MFGYAPGELAGAAVELLVPERFAMRTSGIGRSTRSIPVLARWARAWSCMGAGSTAMEFPVEIQLSPMQR